MAIAFGIGMGLTLDEFALWLNLEDVYWSQKGRQSIDAVIVTSLACSRISLLGLQFWIDVYEALLVLLGVGGERLDGGETAFVLVPIQVAGACLALICFLKGKRMTAGRRPVRAARGARGRRCGPPSPARRWTRAPAGGAPT